MAQAPAAGRRKKRSGETATTTWGSLSCCCGYGEMVLSKVNATLDRAVGRGRKARKVRMPTVTKTSFPVPSPPCLHVMLTPSVKKSGCIVALAPHQTPAWVGLSFVIRSVLGAEAGSETSLHVKYFVSSMSSVKSDVNLLVNYSLEARARFDQGLGHFKITVLLFLNFDWRSRQKKSTVFEVCLATSSRTRGSECLAQTFQASKSSAAAS